MKMKRITINVKLHWQIPKMWLSKMSLDDARFLAMLVEKRNENNNPDPYPILQRRVSANDLSILWSDEKKEKHWHNLKKLGYIKTVVVKDGYWSLSLSEKEVDEAFGDFDKDRWDYCHEGSDYEGPEIIEDGKYWFLCPYLCQPPYKLPAPPDPPFNPYFKYRLWLKEYLEEKDRKWEQRQKEKQAKKNRLSPGYVYLFLCRKSGDVKIGKSVRPRRRLYDVEDECKRKNNGRGRLKLIHKIKTNDMTWLEKKLHKRYSRKRLDGEWFKLTDKIIRILSSKTIRNRKTSLKGGRHAQ